MTRSQLVKKVASLIEGRLIKILIGPRIYLEATLVWNSWNYADLEDYHIIYPDGKIDFSVKNTKKPDWSPLAKINKEIKAVCNESDRQAKAAKVDKSDYFSDILAEAETRGRGETRGRN